MNAGKFQRFYILTIQGATQLWTVMYPFTLRMEVSRSMLASVNTARLTIYNLPPQMRQDIFMDRTSCLAYRQVILKAGYYNVQSTPQGGKTLAVYPGPTPSGQPPPNANVYKCFQGNVMSCGSERRGADWVTTLEAFDGGLAMYSPKSNVNVSLSAPWTGLQAAKALVSGMQNVTFGTVTQSVQIPGSTERGYAAQGDAWTLLQDLVKTSRQQQGDQEITGYAFIDNETVNIAMEQDVLLPNIVQLIKGAVPPGPGTGSQFTWPQLNAGIIGYPRRQAGIVEVDLVFSPQIQIGQQATLDVYSFPKGTNPTAFEWNGTYQVRGLRHEGTISGAFDGGCTTRLQLFDASKALTGALVGVA